RIIVCELSGVRSCIFIFFFSRVKKLKETLVTVQQLDKNMSNLRSWLSRIQAELSRPITYSVCHEREIQRRLGEQQELQRDIEQHTEGVASVLSLCDVLLQDADAAGGYEAESDSLQETSRSLDQRWRTICVFFFLFACFFCLQGFQRQVHERLTQLELINNQYRRLARENRTDRASQLKAMVREGNQRWDSLHRRVAAILRRLKHFTSQREEFEGTRESMLVWLTELDLQLTNVEHFSESDVHQKIQQLNSFQKEITLNTERIDGLIVFGEALIQKSSPQDAALMEDELEELHSYCQEVFSRLVRFHQRLCQPPTIKEEPDISDLTFSLESSLELIGRPWLGRSQASLPATPTHLLSSPLERSGRETPVSVDSLPLEWDHTGDVGGSSSHEDDEEEEEHEDGATYFSALSGTFKIKSFSSDRLLVAFFQLQLVSQCSDSIENIKRVSLILDDDDEEQPEEFDIHLFSGVIERWELRRAQSRSSPDPQQMTSDLDKLTSWLQSVVPELDRLLQSKVYFPLNHVLCIHILVLRLQEMDKAFCHYKAIMLSVNLQAKDAPELQGRVARANRDWSRACTGLQQWDHSLRERLIRCQVRRNAKHLYIWGREQDYRFNEGTVMVVSESICQLSTFHHIFMQQETIHISIITELRSRQAHQASLQALWSQLQPEDGAEDGDEAQEKLHVTGSKLRQLGKKVEQDLGTLQQRLLSQDPGCAAAADPPQDVASLKAGPSTRRCVQRPILSYFLLTPFLFRRQRRESSPPRSFFSRLLRAAFPVQLLLLLLLLLPCLIPLSESGPGCTVTNNFARSFYPMLHYTNGPPPT
uniref:KASH domain-containing protein n=1 Tax=Fundulus heteroclitus TaxID=8078 RepID=A0A3Q2PMA9_FUNHE